MDDKFTVCELSCDEFSSMPDSARKPNTTVVTSETVKSGNKTVTTVTETVRSVVPAPETSIADLPTVTTQSFLEDAEVEKKLRATEEEFRYVKVRMTPDRRIVCGHCAHYMKVKPRQAARTVDHTTQGHEQAFEGSGLEYEVDGNLHVHRHHHKDKEVHYHTHAVV